MANSLFENALVLEGVDGDLAALARSIYEQESGSGKNTATSNADAHGGMQIIPATFAAMADEGWDINDPMQNARAGIRYLKHLSEGVAGGDPRLTAIGYYGGPGAVGAAKRGQARKDPRNPNAPDTFQYADSVLGRITGEAKQTVEDIREGTVPPKAPLGDAYRSEVQDLWDSLGMNGATAAVKEVGKEPTLTPLNAQDILTATAEVLPSTAEQQAKQAEADWAWKEGVTFLDQVSVAWDDTSIGAGMRTLRSPSQENDPAFNPVDAFNSLKLAHDLDADDAVSLLAAGNKERFDWTVQDIERRRSNAKTMAAGGVLSSIGAGIVAGAADPLTYITAGAGMKTAAMAGMSGYSAAVVGGAIGNVGYDVARDIAGADVSGSDYVASAMLGGGMGLIGHRFLGGADRELATHLMNTRQNIIKQRAALLDQARSELPATASAAEVSQRANEIELKEALKVAELVLAQPTEGSRLIPRSLDMSAADPESYGGMLQALKRNIGILDDDGLDFVPSDTVREALRGIIKQAQDGLKANPLDTARIRLLSESLSESGTMKGMRSAFGSTALELFRSKSPVAQWWASVALENTTGVTRRATAAITKYQLEHMYLGDVKNEFDALFHAWRKSRGEAGRITEFFTNSEWKKFNDAVFRHREAMRMGETVPQEGIIAEASRLLTKQYDMMRRHQIQTKVSGFGNLPNSSHGYNPWAISPKKWRALSEGQKLAYTRALATDVHENHGWDYAFSEYFARQYVDQVNAQVNAGVHTNVRPNESAVGVLETALRAYGMDDKQIAKHLKEFTEGGRRQTKGRVDRDLLNYHEDFDGGVFSLMDAMETDNIALLERQARRVSGEVALANWGVTSEAELQLMRTAMEHTGATPRELEAFDQTVAEMLGKPFNKQSPQFVDDLRAATSLVQLGGMGFAQLMETGNMVGAVGVAATLKKVPSFARLYKEVRAMSRSEAVSNPMLKEIDAMVGGIGMEHYRNSWAHQMGDTNEVVYGRDSVGSVSKLIRGGQHLQGKLSMWRAIHAVQTRATAEMMINKALTYVKAGKDTAALRDIGISPELAKRIQADLKNVATFDAKGNVATFNPLNATDQQAMQALTQAVMRGTAQVIQGTFVGETGKWVADPILKFMTQFRTYSITSFEKQFIRQVKTHGGYKAVGLMLGAISVAAPIYIARTMLAGAALQGEAWEKYKENRLSASSIGMAALGYTAMGGWARDMLDIGLGSIGVDVPGSPRTPRGGFVSGLIPGLSLVEDFKNSATDLVQRGDPGSVLRVLPFGRTPFIQPLLQGLSQ